MVSSSKCKILWHGYIWADFAIKRLASIVWGIEEARAPSLQILLKYRMTFIQPSDRYRRWECFQIVGNFSSYNFDSLVRSPRPPLSRRPALSTSIESVTVIYNIGWFYHDDIWMLWGTEIFWVRVECVFAYTSMLDAKPRTTLWCRPSKFVFGLSGRWRAKTGFSAPYSVSHMN